MTAVVHEDRTKNSALLVTQDLRAVIEAGGCRPGGADYSIGTEYGGPGRSQPNRRRSPGVRPCPANPLSSLTFSGHVRIFDYAIKPRQKSVAEDRVQNMDTLLVHFLRQLIVRASYVEEPGFRAPAPIANMRMNRRTGTMTGLVLALFGLLLSGPVSAAEPAAKIPFRPSATPSWQDHDLNLRQRKIEAGKGTTFLSHAIRVAPDLGPSSLRKIDRPGFSQQLMTRMEYEVRRYRGPELDNLSGEFAPIDSIAEAQRADQAERILKRSINRTLDRHLENFARTTLRLDPAFEWVENLGGLRNRLRRGKDVAARDTTSPDTAVGDISRRPSRFSAGLGFKVSRNPKVILKTKFFGIRGRIKVPLLDNGVSVSFDRALGRYGSASLSGGASESLGDWAAFNINLSF